MAPSKGKDVMDLPSPMVRRASCEKKVCAPAHPGFWSEAKGLVAFAVASFVVMVAIPANVIHTQMDRSPTAASPAGAAARSLLDGRRLATTSDSTASSAFEFWTRTEMTLCHSTPTSVTASDMLGLIRTVYKLTASSDDAMFTTQGAGVTNSTGAAATACIKTSGNSAFAGDQFVVKIYNPPADTTDANATPASTAAADQVDQVHDAPSDFFAALVAAETASHSRRQLAVASTLSSSQMFVSQLGFIVGFVDTASTASESTTTAGTTTIGGHKVYFPWWAWLLYALIVVCCLLPLVVCVCRRRKEAELEEENADYVAKARQQEGLSKIYGPEWGITEVDFEEDYMHYEDRDMQAEYNGAHASGAGAAAYNNSQHNPDAAGVADAAWEQQAGAARSDWAAPRKEEGDQSMPARRFDIDDDAAGKDANSFGFDD